MYFVSAFHLLSCCLVLAYAFPDDKDPQDTGILNDLSDCKFSEGIRDRPECAHYLLQRYGFEKQTKGLSSISSSATSEALKRYQNFYQLPETGLLDNATVTLLAEPRCGLPDEDSDVTEGKRRKRYVTAGSRWRNRDLTWCIKDFSQRMTQQGQRDAVRKALQMWSDNANIRFTELLNCRSSVDIEVRFASGYHGDRDAFDGEHGTLAHAYYPRFGGDAHFDDDERWAITMTNRRQKRFIPVATHEFGHSLGLGHSRDRDAIMYAYYIGNRPITELNSDDINGIQDLYGRNTDNKPATPRPVTPRPRPQPTPQPAPANTPIPPTDNNPINPYRPVCSIPRPTPKAMVMLGDGYTYAFSGNYYWRMNTTKVVDPLPKKISDNWKNYRGSGISGPFDAVLFYPTETCTPTCAGNTFFFQGSNVWVQRSSKGVSGTMFSYRISQLFDGLRGPISAATLLGRTKRVYIFKGTQYYRTTMRNKEVYKIDSGYPKSISRYWRMGWDSVDAAVYYWHYTRPSYARTYLFKGGQYIRYNERYGRKDAGYPRSVSVSWYGCSASGNMQYMPSDGDSEVQAFGRDTDDVIEDDMSHGAMPGMAGGLNGEDVDSGSPTQTSHVIGLMTSLLLACLSLV